MIKYFCDICGKEVSSDSKLAAIKILDIPAGPYVSGIQYQACISCRTNINNHILKIQEESKNGNT